MPANRVSSPSGTTALIGVAQFPNGDPIDCRHFAVAYATSERKSDFLREMNSRRSAERCMSGNRLEAMVGRPTTILASGIAPSGFGACVKELAEEMRANRQERSDLLVALDRSPARNHAVAGCVKVKPKNAQSDHEVSVTYYDPHRTNTHSKWKGRISALDTLSPIQPPPGRRPPNSISIQSVD